MITKLTIEDFKNKLSYGEWRTIWKIEREMVDFRFLGYALRPGVAVRQIMKVIDNIIMLEPIRFVGRHSTINAVSFEKNHFTQEKFLYIDHSPLELLVENSQDS